MRGRLRIGSIRGIPIYISTTWIWIAALYTYSFYLEFTHTGAVTSGAATAFAILATGLFFGSVFVHELGHAIVARMLGLGVAGITLEFWGGRTETQADRRGPREEFLVSAVGPASTLVLAGIFFVASKATGLSSPIPQLMDDLARTNLVLGLANAVPGFPLDGGRVFLSAAWAVTGSRERAYSLTSSVGVVVGVALGIAGFYAFTAVQTGMGSWLGFVGIFLAIIIVPTSRNLRARAAAREVLARGRASEAMGPPPATIPAEMSLSQALDVYLRNRPDESFLVAENGGIVGVVSFGSARPVGARDPLRPVRDAVVPLDQIPTFPPGEPLDGIVDRLQGREGLVVEGGRVLGSISARSIGRWFERRASGAIVGVGAPVPPRPDR